MNTQHTHNLRIVDEFVTVQGTGHLVGVPQYFVRLAGCSVYSCPIRKECDERGALNPRAGEFVDPDELAKRATRRMGQGGWLHITGGEPFDQLEGLSRLSITAQRLGLRIHYQTSGTRKVDLPWDWITVSPKCETEDLQLKFGQEVVLVDRGHSLEELDSLVKQTRFWFYYLQPLWGQDPKETIEKVLQAQRKGIPFGFTDQMHKRWEVK